MRHLRAEPVLEAGALLGEGAAWDSQRQRLVWVDILAGRLHLFDPATGDDAQIEVGQHLGAAVPRAAGGFTVAVRDGFARLGEDGGLAMLADLSVPGVRMNDGKCAPDGAFWAGTMAYDETPGAGTLYRLDPGGEVRVALAGVTISNGMAWAPGGRQLYYVDTPTRRVDLFDVSPDQTLSGRRPAVALPEGPGVPDGMAMDDDGCLWVALWGGGAVHRYRPDGELDTVVDVGTSQVTSCCFGGPRGDELYITTAREGLTGGGDGLAGALFCCRPGQTGPPATPCAGP